MMGEGDTVTQPALLDLIDRLRWQRLQDHCASVLGVVLRTVNSAGQLLTTPSWPSGLEPDRIIRALGIGDELPQLIPLAQPPREPTQLTSPYGTTYAAIPLHAAPTLLSGYVVMGPLIAGRRETEAEARQRLHALQMDADAIWPLLISIKAYSFTSLRSVIGFLQDVGNTIVQLAYQTQQFARLMPESAQINASVTTYYTHRLLQSLLEAATLTTKADGGSVLAYDEQAGAFQIRAAQGLSDEVVRSTRLKAGEGLAGLVMAGRKILLVDDRTTDPHLRARMRRPELTSAIVAPLIPESSREPIGALNLYTLATSSRLTEEHVTVLGKLLDLTAIALGSLKVVAAPARQSTPS